jgi:NADPH:quinone reductase-like Zn-dependent oxidoreductase
MPRAIPEQMRAVVLETYHEDAAAAIAGLKIVERPVPKPARGQVLVKIEAAPCNPSDLLLLQGRYGTLKTLPSVPGWEGAGTVVASGGGWLGRWFEGKRVACALSADRDGTWAQYFVADVMECIPLKSRLDFEQAASLIVNPLTAIGLIDTARREGHSAAIATAGASQLGRMLLSIAADAKFPLISVVRRDAQVQLLKSLGAEHVLNSSDATFLDQLQAACRQLRATAAFEAIGGEMTGTLLAAMPQGATAYLYGALSESACSNLDPVQIIFHQKTLTGFYLGQWIHQRGKLRVLLAASRAQQMLIDGRIQTKIQQRLALDEVVSGLTQYIQHMTDGKMLIRPHT